MQESENGRRVEMLPVGHDHHYKNELRGVRVAGPGPAQHRTYKQSQRGGRLMNPSPLQLNYQVLMDEGFRELLSILQRFWRAHPA